MTASQTSSPRSARLLKFKSVAITHLKQEIAAYRTSIKKQSQKITDVEDELESFCDLIANRSDSPPSDIIFSDLCHNRSLWWIAVIYGGSLRWITESCEGCRLRTAERNDLWFSSERFPFYSAKWSYFPFTCLDVSSIFFQKVWRMM
jgi:hypothetical protein